MSSPSSAGSPAPEDQQVFTAHEQPPPAQEDLAAPGDDELEDSFFPSPAHYYKRYTTVNLALGPTELLPPIDGEPACLAAELLPPDVEAIVQRGAYEVFGETWPVEEVLPSLTDMGVEELFDRGADRSTSLTLLLQALLISYTTLVSTLLAPPPSTRLLDPTTEPPHATDSIVDHIRLITINMHHLVNELRPVQARETLKGMMRAQIDLRRAQTLAIKQKCAELNATLSGLHEGLVLQNTPIPASTSGVKVEEVKGTPRESTSDRLRSIVDALEMDD